MSPQIDDRLREASLVLGDDSKEALATASARLGSLRLGLDEILVRVRLSYGLDVNDAGLNGLLGQINRDRPLVDKNDRQMISLLCSMGLIALFSESDPSRSAATVRRQTIAAIGVRTLKRGGLQPAHPDLYSWATHWLEAQARSMREYRRSRPPRPKAVAPDTERGVLDSVQLEIESLRDAAGQTAEWLERQGGVASIEALREQMQLFWWLNSSSKGGDASSAAIQAAVDLVSITFIPPPVAANELLSRRLAILEDVLVNPEEFEVARQSNEVLAGAARPVPDLTPVVTFGLLRPVAVSSLSHALYEEILLAGLVEHEGRAIEGRREARRKAGQSTAGIGGSKGGD